MRETPCSPTRQIHTDIAINTADDAPFHCFPPPAWSRDRFFWYNLFLSSGIAYYFFHDKFFLHLNLSFFYLQLCRSLTLFEFKSIAMAKSCIKKGKFSLKCSFLL